MEYWGELAEAFISPLQLHRAGHSRGEKGVSLITWKSVPPAPSLGRAGVINIISHDLCAQPGDILLLSTGQNRLHVPDCQKHWLLIATINDDNR